MANQIEISIDDVTDMEAHVVARYTGDAANVEVRGVVRGPYSEVARTLPAEFPLRSSDGSSSAVAEALVTDPCMWTAEIPLVYRLEVEARQGDRVVAECHDTIGLRRLAPRRPVDFAPGTG